MDTVSFIMAIEDGTITDSEFAQNSITNDKLTQEAQDLILGNIVTFGI
jgi:hypothetical protein